MEVFAHIGKLRLLDLDLQNCVLDLDSFADMEQKERDEQIVTNDVATVILDEKSKQPLQGDKLYDARMALALERVEHAIDNGVFLFYLRPPSKWFSCCTLCVLCCMMGRGSHQFQC